MFDETQHLVAWNRKFQEILDVPDDIIARRPTFQNTSDTSPSVANMAPMLIRRTRYAASSSKPTSTDALSSARVRTDG